MIKYLSTCILACICLNIFAQDQVLTSPKYRRNDVYITPEVHENANLVLDLSLLDLPYLIDASKAIGNSNSPALGNYFKSYSSPGMNIGLNLTYSTYSATHYALKRAVTIEDKFAHNVVLGVGVAATDIALYYLPLGTNWLHNEYIKAGFAANHIDASNRWNHFTYDQGNVFKVSDANLEYLRTQYNSNYKRNFVTGLEADYLLMDKLQKTNFFYKSNIPNLVLYWMISLKNINSISNQTDYANGKSKLDKMYTFINGNPDNKDYAGMEYTAWAHALFFPDSSLYDRKNHTGNVGANRYVYPSQFSKEEIAYMRTEAMLHYLNCLSPAMFGIKGITVKKSDVGDAWRLNFTTRHLFTPFGNDVSGKIYFQSSNYNWIFTLHNYNNFNHTFNGVEVELSDYLFKTKTKEIPVSFKGMIWMQPKDYEFKTSKSMTGGLVQIKAEFPLSNTIRPYIDLEAKSNGWVAGNPYLKSNFSIRAGLTAVFGAQ